MPACCGNSFIMLSSHHQDVLNNIENTACGLPVGALVKVYSISYRDIRHGVIIARSDEMVTVALNDGPIFHVTDLRLVLRQNVNPIEEFEALIALSGSQ